MSSDEEEIQHADTIRSFMAVIESWENDDINIEDMTRHLECLAKVMGSELDYHEFLEKVGLTGIKKQ